MLLHGRQQLGSFYPVLALLSAGTGAQQHLLTSLTRYLCCNQFTPGLSNGCGVCPCWGFRPVLEVLGCPPALPGPPMSQVLLSIIMLTFGQWGNNGGVHWKVQDHIYQWFYYALIWMYITVYVSFAHESQQWSQVSGHLDLIGQGKDITTGFYPPFLVVHCKNCSWSFAFWCTICNVNKMLTFFRNSSPACQCHPQLLAINSLKLHPQLHGNFSLPVNRIHNPTCWQTILTAFCLLPAPPPFLNQQKQGSRGHAGAWALEMSS